METGWAPFNGPNGKSYLGDLDVAFLGSYAIGMFLAGELGPLGWWPPVVLAVACRVISPHQQLWQR